MKKTGPNKAHQKPKSHVYYFEPSDFITKKFDLHQLDRMKKTATRIHDGSTRLVTPMEFDRLHPYLRDRLSSQIFPFSTTPRDIEAQVKDIRAAEELIKMGPKGIKLLPAQVNVGPVIDFADMPSLRLATVDFRPPDMPRNLRLKLSAYVSTLAPDKYIIEAYGMQGSDHRKYFPKGMHHLYDYGAPTLGLALVTKGLKKSGAKKVLLSGPEYADYRKSYKRPEFLDILKETAVADNVPPATRKLAEKLAVKWPKMSEEEMESAVSGSWELHTLGFPKFLRQRYYTEIPARFKHSHTILKHPKVGKHFDFYDLDLKQFQPIGPFFRRHGE